METIIKAVKKMAHDPKEVTVQERHVTIVTYRDMEIIFQDGELVNVNLMPYGMVVSVTDAHIDNGNILKVLKTMTDFIGKIGQIDKTPCKERDIDEVEELSPDGLKSALNMLGITNA